MALLVVSIAYHEYTMIELYLSISHAFFGRLNLSVLTFFIYPAELESIDQTEEEKDDYLAQAVFEQMHLNDDEVCKSLFVQIKKISLLGEPLVNGHEWYTMHMIAEKGLTPAWVLVSLSFLYSVFIFTFQVMHLICIIFFSSEFPFS